MDLKSIGKFISEQRKNLNLTQAKLAEMLYISEKTVSKWECGKGFPETSLILPLCKILNISANELLSGRLLQEKEYKTQAEENLIQLNDYKQKSAKFLLTIMWVLGFVIIAFFIGITCLAAYTPLQEWLRLLIIIPSTVLVMISSLFLLKMEQMAGYYKCSKCGYTHVPTYKSVLLASHYGTTRLLKCPHCKKTCWHKKVINKNQED